MEFKMDKVPAVLLTLPTYYREFCGIRDVAVKLVRKLQPKYEVHIAATSTENRYKYLDDQIFRFLNIESWDYRGILAICNYVKDHKINVVDIQYASEGYSNRNAAVCRLPKMLKDIGVGCVVSVHELGPPKWHPRLPHVLNLPYGTFYTRNLLKHADVVVVHANWIPGWLKTHWSARLFGLSACCKPRLVLLPPTLDMATTQINCSDNPVENGLIVCFGFIAPKRDCATVIRAVAKLKGKGLRLVFAGAIPDQHFEYRKRMNALANELGIVVEWTGGLDGKSIFRWVQKAHVNVVSQRARAIFQKGGVDFNSSSLRNVSYAGRPIVAPEGPFVPMEIRERVALYSPGDPYSLAGAIARAGGEEEDALANKARSLAKLFTLEGYVNGMSRAYEEAIRKSAR